MTEIDELLNQQVTIETFHSIDLNGDPSYNAGATYIARVERRIKIVRALTGDQAVSTNGIFLDGAVSSVLDPFGRDRITLPDGTKPIILAIEDGVDGDGTTMYVEVDT